MQCKIKILDNANCVIFGLTPDHYNYFHEEYSEYAPNYRFNPKYKLGAWDGKLRYFRKTGKTFVNLLPDLVPRVIGLKYHIELIDDRPPAIRHDVPTIDKDVFRHIVDPETGEPWQMREYQIEFVNGLISNGGGVGIAGTGAGKTSMTAALALSYELSNNLKSIIIVPDKSLTVQTFKEYQFFGLDVGEYSGTTKDLTHQHTVSTWQALQHNPIIMREFDVVIVDECHGAKGQVISDLINVHGINIPFRFGVTGTLPKEPADRMAVKIALGDTQCEIPAWKLIDDGFLAKIQIDVMMLKVDLKAEYQEYLEDQEKAITVERPLTYIQFKRQSFPDWPSEKQFFQTEQERLDWIANDIIRKSHTGNLFCLTVGVQFGKRLAKLIPDAVYLYGEDDVTIRQQAYELFKTHDNLIIIANAKIASTGLNIKRIFHMYLVDIGKSFITTIQGIGRGLRLAKDKDSVLVTDVGSDLYYSRRHMNERIAYYKEARYPFTKKTVDYT